MALNLDVSKLTQSAAMKATPHDNCIVLDLGTGAFPRDIEVRLPDDDGARQNALWDGSLNLAVNDEVLCFEYSGISAWRIMAMGGNDSGAGQVRVSEVWESDFGAVALQADANGDIGIGTAGPDAKLDILDTGGAQLRLTFEDGVKFVDLTLDTNQDLTITPSGTGQIKLQPTTDSDAFFQVLTLGGDRVFGVDTANRRVAVNTLSPDAKLEVEGITGAQLRLTFADSVKFVDFTSDTNHHLTIDPSSTGQIKLNATVTVIDEIQHEGDADNKIGFTDDVQTFTVGGEVLLTLTEAGQDVVKIGDGGDVDINFNDDMFLEGSTGFFGIGINAAPSVDLHIKRTAASTGLFVETTLNTSFAQFRVLTATTFFLEHFQFGSAAAGTDAIGVANAGLALMYVGAGTTNMAIRTTNSSANILFGAGTGVEDMRLNSNGDVGIGTVAPSGQLHVDQASTTAAQPVLLLDQADISEEMIEFATTIGVGNAIEAVGAKSLTVTHFIKVTLPGSLTRYIEVGTIA